MPIIRVMKPKDTLLQLAYSSIGIVIFWTLVLTFAGWFHPLILLGLSAIPIYLLAVNGFVTVKQKHQAILLHLGETRYDVLLGEGVHWLIPFIQTIGEEDLREKSTKVENLRFPVGKVEVVTKPGSEPVKHYEMAHFLISLTFQWHVVDLFALLNIGTDELSNSLKHQMLDALRELGTHHTPIEFLTLQRDELRAKIMNILTHEDANNADDNPFRRWGIKLLQALIPRLEIEDAELKKAFEKLTMELRERTGEAVEMAHVAKMVIQLSKDANISQMQALAAYQTQMGHVQTFGFLGDGDDNNMLTQAAALLKKENG